MNWIELDRGVMKLVLETVGFWWALLGLLSNVSRDMIWSGLVLTMGDVNYAERSMNSRAKRSSE